MNPILHTDNSPRLPTPALILLAGGYLLAGVAAHDPWKPSDVIHIDIAYGFASGSNWLTPAVAGEVWPHTAPLYHWIAALLAALLRGLLDFHNAARLATTLFGVLFLLGLAGAARSLYGDAAGRLAPLLAIGTLGLLLPLHEAQPAIAGLGCAALAWWGGGLIRQGETHGGALLGLGIGLAFLAHGLVGLIMACAVLPVPIYHRNKKALALALLVATPLAAVWPVLLMQQAPEFWTQWWHNEFAEATRGRVLPGMLHFKQLAWAAWPLWPLALWSLWLHRRHIGPLSLPLFGIALSGGWYFSGDAGSLAVLPLSIPLVLLAAAGAGRLRRGAANAFDWFGVITFSFLIGLVWLGASAQGLGWPAPLARNFTKLAPGLEIDFGIGSLAIAAGLTLLWPLSWALRRAAWRSSLRWAWGLTLLWVLGSLLWLPWIDHAISYRPVAQALRQVIPQDADCIERGDFGLAKRASLDYFAGLRTVPPTAGKSCHWRLSVAAKNRPVPVGWHDVWQGARTSDRKERWYLDRRAD